MWRSNSLGLKIRLVAPLFTAFHARRACRLTPQSREALLGRLTSHASWGKLLRGSHQPALRKRRPRGAVLLQRNFGIHIFSNALVCCALTFLFSGCAIHYFDPRTGAEHLWGFGHMKMKSAPVDDRAEMVVTGVETLGVSIGAGRDNSHVMAGWNNQQRIVLSTNTSVSLAWPDEDFFNVRLGRTPPFLTNAPKSTP
jgi:hypothetical protein